MTVVATSPGGLAAEGGVLARLRAEFPDWGFVFDGHRWWAIRGRRILVHGTDPGLLRAHLMDVHGRYGPPASASGPVVQAARWPSRKPVASPPIPAGRSHNGRVTRHERYRGVHARADAGGT